MDSSIHRASLKGPVDQTESTIELERHAAAASDHSDDEEAQPALRRHHAPVTGTVLVSCFLAVMHSFSFGWAIGVPNNSRPAMHQVFDMSTETWRWIVSLYALGAIVGGLLGPFTGVIGPKRSMFAADLVWIASGIIAASAPPAPSPSGPAMLMAARVLNGVAVGFACAAVPPYIVDIAPSHVRGAMSVLHQLFVVLGNTASIIMCMDTILGNAQLWWVAWGFYVFPATLNFAMVFFPDSPRFLFNKGRIDATRQALRQLRGSKYNVEAEIEQYALDKKREEESGKALGLREAVGVLFTRYRKQITVAMLLQIMQQLSGINAINFYSSSIMRDSGIDGQLGAVVVSCANVVAAVTATQMIDRLGRRWLLIAGFGVMAAALVLECVALTLAWGLPSVVFLVFGVMAFQLGPGPIPWLVSSELLPSIVRPGGVTICVVLNWVGCFLVGQFYPPLQAALGTYSLLPFGVGCAIAAAYVVFLVPETKGKSVSEIEEIFIGKRVD